MSDQPKPPAPDSGTTLPGQGSASPAVQPPASPGQAAGVGQVYLTREEFDNALRELENKIIQRAQSNLGRNLGHQQAGFENKIRDELAVLKQSIELAKASGVQISTDQERIMQSTAIARAFESPPQETPQVGDAQPQLEQDLDDPVVLSAIGMSDRYGFQIEDNDPEMSMIYQGDDGYQFLQSWDKALQAKAARLGKAIPGQQPPVQPPHTPTNAGGAGGATNQNYNNIRDIDELEKKIFT